MLGVLLALSGVLAFTNWTIITTGSFECPVTFAAPSSPDVNHMELWETYGGTDILIDDNIPCIPGATVWKVVSVQEGWQTFKARSVDGVGNESAFSPSSSPVRGVIVSGELYIIEKS